MSDGALKKLQIRVEDAQGKFDTVIEALFNPNRITLQKTAVWKRVERGEKDTASAHFVGGEPATLTVDLFFDTYEQNKDVLKKTRPIFHLTTIEKHGDLHRPPLCQLQWGNNDFEGFQWVLQRLTQTLTLFRGDGTPVRATLACTFRQWRGDKEEAQTLTVSSPDVAKLRVARRGETLSSIAAEEYNDPALWRPIAEANGIDNPRRLVPGTALAIPPLRPGGSARS
jgi:nucleoid-associated protein YgaU